MYNCIAIYIGVLRRYIVTSVNLKSDKEIQGTKDAVLTAFRKKMQYFLVGTWLQYRTMSNALNPLGLGRRSGSADRVGSALHGGAVSVLAQEAVKGLPMSDNEFARLNARVVDTKEGVDVIHGLSADVRKLLNLSGRILDLQVKGRKAMHHPDCIFYVPHRR